MKVLYVSFAFLCLDNVLPINLGSIRGALMALDPNVIMDGIENVKLTE